MQELNIQEVADVNGAIAPLLWFGLAAAVTIAVGYYAD